MSSNCIEFGTPMVKWQSIPPSESRFFRSLTIFVSWKKISTICTVLKAGLLVTYFQLCNLWLFLISTKSANKNLKWMKWDNEWMDTLIGRLYKKTLSSSQERENIFPSCKIKNHYKNLWALSLLLHVIWK